MNFVSTTVKKRKKEKKDMPLKNVKQSGMPFSDQKRAANPTASTATLEVNT